MGKLGKLGKFHVQVCSGNVHASDCGSAHCNGCVVNGISARTACIYDIYIYNSLSSGEGPRDSKIPHLCDEGVAPKVHVQYTQVFLL